MAKTILGVMQKERDDKGLVDIPYLTERMAASIGGHVFNLHNLDLNEQNSQKAYFDSGELENFRLHIVMMAPSGFGKSTSFRLLLHPERGMLSKVGLFGTTLRSTFTPESWIGTATSHQGNVVTKQGIFNRHKRDIVGADEFMRFVGMMDTEKVDTFSNEEVYLLTALDTDGATKDMSYATIDETGIGTTLWAGSRISSIDMKHGLARRVLFQIFIPTPNTCQLFRDSMINPKRRKSISELVKDEMNSAIVHAKRDLGQMGDIDMTQFYEYLRKPEHKNIPHFEVNLLKRIAIGLSVARNTLPDIVMDEELLALMHDELNSRHIIRGNPELEIVKRIIEESGTITGDDLKEFLSQWYQFTEQKIRSLLHTMGTFGIIEVKRTSKGKEYSMAKKKTLGGYAL